MKSFANKGLPSVASVVGAVMSLTSRATTNGHWKPEFPEKGSAMGSAAAETVSRLSAPTRRQFMNAQRILTRAGSLLSFVCLLFFTVLLVRYSNSRSYPGAIQELSFDGTTRSIDLQGRQWTAAPLKPSVPVVLVFAWESATKFSKNDLPIQADAVEAGRNVRIHYHEEFGWHGCSPSLCASALRPRMNLRTYRSQLQQTTIQQEKRKTQL